MKLHLFLDLLPLLIGMIIVLAMFILRRLRRNGVDLAPGWQVRCLTCGLTFDAGDLGIVRLRAMGASYLLRQCGQCGKLRKLIVERRPSDLPERAGPRCDLATHATA